MAETFKTVLSDRLQYNKICEGYRLNGAIDKILEILNQVSVFGHSGLINPQDGIITAQGVYTTPRDPFIVTEIFEEFDYPIIVIDEDESEPEDRVHTVGPYHRLSEEYSRRVLEDELFTLSVLLHPDRISAMRRKSNGKYVPPTQTEYDNTVIDLFNRFTAPDFADFSSSIPIYEQDRISYRKLLAEGEPLVVDVDGAVSLPFIGSETPDVWNTPWKQAVMLLCGGKSVIPRNGMNDTDANLGLGFKDSIDIQIRQAQETLCIVDMYLDILVEDEEDRDFLRENIRKNYYLCISNDEKSVEEALKFREETGLNNIRVYFARPDIAQENVKALAGKGFKVIVGNCYSAEQAKILENAGAAGTVWGIGGSQGCATPEQSDSNTGLVKELLTAKGQLKNPIYYQGSASDQPTIAALCGVQYIGMSKKTSGVIEDPGGDIFVMKNGILSRIVGNEASPRTKDIEGKVYAGGRVVTQEGTTRLVPIKDNPEHGMLPHLPATLLTHIEIYLLGLIFRGVHNFDELQRLDPSPLVVVSAGNNATRRTYS